MEYFVDKHSIVRQIWGRSDTILFIFAGASAEFALNKAVDWLYFTGRLPQDPLGRLFSTVSYSHKILLSEKNTALRTIDAMSAIHAGVENKRSMKIPDWAYRDVLFMLIDYSIRAYEVLYRPLTYSEKQEVFFVFHRLGLRMGLKDLPDTFEKWILMREQHLRNNLQYSSYTNDLFLQYKKHLGFIRYKVLLGAQVLVTPGHVKTLLKLNDVSIFKSLIFIYKMSRKIKLDWIFRSIIFPSKYKAEMRAMENAPIKTFYILK